MSTSLLGEIADTFRKYVSYAQTDPELELELHVDLPISSNMFTKLVKHLHANVGAPDETVQLDIQQGKTRLEYVGEDMVRHVLSTPDRRLVRPTRAVLKRRDRARLDHPFHPLTVHLNRETIDLSEASAPATPDVTAFRLKRRASFTISDRYRVDCTVVQQRNQQTGTEASIPFQFEVEIELINDAEVARTDASVVMDGMCEVAKRCISVMTGSSGNLSRSDINRFFGAYQAMTGVRSTKRLAGPQPVTLTRKDVLPPSISNAELGAGRLWNGAYCVTDKADGVRCQLFCVGDDVFTIDATMTLRKVAARVNRRFDGSWLDGELILSSRDEEAMNHFACFDAYNCGDTSVAELPLLGEGRSRLNCAREVIEAVLSGDTLDGFTASVKTFLRVQSNGLANRSVLDLARSTYPYDTDGLIFTPADVAVGGRYEGDTPAIDGTWFQTLKWKPPQLNTVDVVVRHSALGDVDGNRVFTMYCAYVARDWEPVDVMRYIKFKERALPSDVPVAKPFDVAGDAYLRVPLDAMSRACAKDGGMIFHNNVVECAYDGKKWVAIRTRPDKTARMKDGSSVSGAANNWTTAMSVWDTINFPVSEEVITRTQDCPATLGNTNDVYYARRDFSRRRGMLRSMANFHNACVKERLYGDAAARSGAGSVFEFACGKGGDMARWARFRRVVGVDVSMDNITNATDGVYRRLSDFRHKRGTQADDGRVAAFVCMDASVNMLPPFDEIKVAAADSPHGELITALWDSSSDQPLTTTSLTPYRGLAVRGFDVVSCQFAVHYMFQTRSMLERFAANVAWLCKPGGTFVGTCFDGDALAREVESAPNGVLKGEVGSSVAWQIKKAYEGRFSGSVGAAVDVFVDSINQSITEYLVSVKTLEAVMCEHGMKKIWVRSFKSFHDEYAGEHAPLDSHEKALSHKYVAFMFGKDA